MEWPQTTLGALRARAKTRVWQQVRIRLRPQARIGLRVRHCRGCQNRSKSHASQKRRSSACTSTNSCGAHIAYGGRACEFDGRFVDDSWCGSMYFEELRVAWANGDIDATWWCTVCHAREQLGGCGTPTELDTIRQQLGIAWREEARMVRAAAWRSSSASGHDAPTPVSDQCGCQSWRWSGTASPWDQGWAGAVWNDGGSSPATGQGVMCQANHSVARCIH